MNFLLFVLTILTFENYFSDRMSGSLNSESSDVHPTFMVALAQNVSKEAAEGSGKSSSHRVRQPWVPVLTYYFCPPRFWASY